MASTTSKLLWCTIRFKEKEGNWWVKENSDPKHYEPDGLGILDPFQFPWILDMMDPLREYGLSNEVLEAAFVPFQPQEIDKDKDQTVRLVRVAEHILDSEEQLFALPNVKDGDKGAYADFLEHIMRLRVKLINDTIKLEQKLTVEDVLGHADEADRLVLLDVLGLERDEGRLEDLVGETVLAEGVHHVEDPGELVRIEDAETVGLVMLRVGVLLHPPVAFLLLETDGAPKEL